MLDVTKSSILACGFLAISVTGCTESQSASVDSATQLSLGSDHWKSESLGAPVDTQSSGFVDQWFEIYRNALSDLSLTHGHWETIIDADGKEQRKWINPEFGMSRIPKFNGHDLTTDTTGIGGRDKLQKLLSTSPTYKRVWGFGNGPKPLTADNLQLKMQQYSWPDHDVTNENALKDSATEFAVQSFSKLLDGQIPSMNLNGWDFEARIMRLTDRACLSCHTENKLGDPVAVFVFATKPKSPSSPR